MDGARPAIPCVREAIQESGNPLFPVSRKEPSTSTALFLDTTATKSTRQILWRFTTKRHPRRPPSFGTSSTNGKTRAGWERGTAATASTAPSTSTRFIWVLGEVCLKKDSAP